MGFLQQVMGQKSKRQRDGTWRSASAARELKEAGTQTLGTYIDKQQSTVAELVVLRPIIEVCDMDIGYKGGGRCPEPWWQHTAAQNQLSTMLKEI